MKSSYKPKFLETFLRQQGDCIPELVEIDSSGAAKQTMIHQSNTSKMKSIRGMLSRDEHHSGAVNQNQFHSKTMTRLIGEVQEAEMKLQQERVSVKECRERLDQYDSIINKLSVKNKQIESKNRELQKANYELRDQKDRLQGQTRELRLQEASYISARSHSPAPVKDQFRREIFQKIQQYIKRIVEQFMKGLKQERLSQSVQGKIEEFMAELLQINSFTVQRMSKSRLGKSIPKQTSNTLDSFLGNQTSMVSRKKLENSPKLVQGHSVRFNFAREAVDPSITQQNAFMSVSQVGNQSLQRSPGRSRSQRRRKIFS